MAVKEVEVEGKRFTISYERLRAENSQVLVFLHGWGSSKEAMKAAFGSRFEQYGHLYIDLPGFGASQNEFVLRTVDYAKIVEEFLARIAVRPFALFGHSFGGKVALMLNPPRLVLLSSAGIPASKPLLVRFKISTFKLLKKFGLSRFWRVFASSDASRMSKNMYETLKNVVDEHLDTLFERYDGMAWVFWGREDTATPLVSGERIAQLLPNCSFHPLDGDHWFFLKHPSFIERTLIHDWRAENLDANI